MKTANSNKFRTYIIKELFDYFSNDNEDCGMISSGSFNFPIVADDGEEGVVEIVVKIPKYDGDEIYALREQYELKCKERAEKEKAKEEVKAKKIAKDKKKREEKES